MAWNILKEFGNLFRFDETPEYQSMCRHIVKPLTEKIPVILILSGYVFFPFELFPVTFFRNTQWLSPV